MRIKGYLLQSLPGLAVLLFWQLMVWKNEKLDFTIGSPLGIAAELRTLGVTADFWMHIGITATEAVLGFLAGCVVGTTVGLSLWLSRTAYEIARPYLIALGSVPVFALAPVLIFWFGTGMLSKVILGFLATFVIAVVQAHSGACEADPNLLRLTKAFGGNRKQMLVTIVFPSAAIWVVAGIRLNIGMALLGAFIGELIAARAGLGHFIMVAQGLYNVNQIWVGVFSIVALAVTFYWLTKPFEKWASRWK